MTNYEVKDESGKVVGYITKEEHERGLQEKAKGLAEAKRLEEARLRAEEEQATGTKIIKSRSGKTYKIKQQGQLSDSQIIEQNKSTLARIEEDKAYQEQVSNTQKVQELQRQYNDIARQSNQAISEENKRIDKARVVAEFANLYPSGKAEEIVKESGYEQYLIKQELPLKDDAPDKTSSIPISEKRFTYDSEKGLWFDKQTKQVSGIMIPKDSKPDLYWFDKSTSSYNFKQKAMAKAAEYDLKRAEIA